jgi:hypothetical protein
VAWSLIISIVLVIAAALWLTALTAQPTAQYSRADNAGAVVFLEIVTLVPCAFTLRWYRRARRRLKELDAER